LIEAITYRLLMHSSADDPRKYRSKEEEAQWWARDPLPRFRGYLEQKGLWNDKEQARLEGLVQEEIDEAVRQLEEESTFKPDAPFDHVFATPTPLLEEQRAEFLQHLQAKQHNPKSREGKAHA
jgi:pyruvate dehydrogenase E1 component alpha subunit